MMEGLKGEIMEGLKIFIIERTPKTENVSHEIHDDDTRKVNQEWINSNFGLKTNNVPKIDMMNFDGKDLLSSQDTLKNISAKLYFLGTTYCLIQNNVVFAYHCFIQFLLDSLKFSLNMSKPSQLKGIRV
jgi:hypothetical protein